MAAEAEARAAERPLSGAMEMVRSAARNVATA
jgi:hypothetical protein